MSRAMLVASPSVRTSASNRLIRLRREDRCHMVEVRIAVPPKEALTDRSRRLSNRSVQQHCAGYMIPSMVSFAAAVI
jgi:hypothetical protein